MGTENAILIAAGLATMGWVYAARRQRFLARKHHTFNVMLHTSWNDKFGEAFLTLAPYIKECNLPNLDSDDQKDLRSVVRRILNHYEFISAGVRNGDIDETLLRDSERGTIIALFKCCHNHIYAVRDTRDRQTVYEHLEWLKRRWDDQKPSGMQRAAEFALCRPLAGKRTKVDG